MLEIGMIWSMSLKQMNRGKCTNDVSSLTPSNSQQEWRLTIMSSSALLWTMHYKMATEVLGQRPQKWVNSYQGIRKGRTLLAMTFVEMWMVKNL